MVVGCLGTKMEDKEQVSSFSFSFLLIGSGGEFYNQHRDLVSASYFGNTKESEHGADMVVI